MFRSYDNRLQPTDRRPDLYVQPNVFSKDTDPIAETVLVITDVNVSLNFGELVSFDSKEDAMDWLWSYKGKLLIISTPFHEGIHYATHPKHFLPIINHLSQLHSQGFVHGDIRAYNMVLHYHAASTPESDQGVIGNSSSNVVCFQVR